jgi:hypothetical protein
MKNKKVEYFYGLLSIVSEENSVSKLSDEEFKMLEEWGFFTDGNSSFVDLSELGYDIKKLIEETNYR